MHKLKDEVESFEDIKKRYRNDPKLFRNEVGNEILILAELKLGKINFIDETQPFNIIRNFCLSNKLNKEIEVDTFPIYSSVEDKDGKSNVNIANSITMKLKDGSHLRFLPSKNNGILISKIYVRPINQSKGNGTKLMNTLFSIIVKSLIEFPEIVLECTGSVGTGSTMIVSDISSQTRFFRKFGFRVVREESRYPNYVKMKFDFSKFLELENNVY